MGKLLKAAIITALVLGGCGDVAAAEGGGFGGTGGTGGKDAEPDLAAECDFESCLTGEDGVERCLYWAEFPVNPGVTEYTACSASDDNYVENWPGHPYAQDFCYRGTAPYYVGTRTGFVTCGHHDFDHGASMRKQTAVDLLTVLACGWVSWMFWLAVVS